MDTNNPTEVLPISQLNYNKWLVMRVLKTVHEQDPNVWLNSHAVHEPINDRLGWVDVVITLAELQAEKYILYEMIDDTPMYKLDR